MSDWRQLIKTEVARMRLRALVGIWTGVLIMLASAVSGAGPHSTIPQILILLSALIAIGAGAHLFFDSKLFQLALAQESESKALDAIDNVLAGMGLRAIPNPPPPLAARIAGTRRIARRQGAALLVAALLLAIQFADTRHFLGSYI